MENAQSLVQDAAKSITHRLKQSQSVWLSDTNYSMLLPFKSQIWRRWMEYDKWKAAALEWEMNLFILTLFGLSNIIHYESFLNR